MEQPKSEHEHETFINIDEDPTSFRGLLSKYPYEFALDADLIVNELNTDLKVSKYKLGSQNCSFMEYFRSARAQNRGEFAKTVNVKADTPGLKELAFIIHFSHLNQIELTLDSDFGIRIFQEKICASLTDALALANQFKNEKLTEICLDFLDSRLNTSNCFSLIKNFKNKEDLQAYTITEDFILKNFPKTISNIHELDRELLEEILTSDRLNVSSEYQVVKAITTWVFKQSFEEEETTIKHLKELFIICLRLNYADEKTKLKLEQIKNYYNTKNLTTNSNTMETRSSPPASLSAYTSHSSWLKSFLKWAKPNGRRRATKRTYNNQSANDREIKSTMTNEKPRLPHEAIFVFGGCYSQTPTASHHIDNNPLSVIQVLNSRTKRWTPLKNLKLEKPLMSHSICLVDNRFIYVSGGETVDFQITQEVFCLDLKYPQRGWTKCPLMYERRRDHVFVHDPKNNRLFVVGGTDVRKVFDTVECLDLNRGLCRETMPTLMIKRAAAAGVVLDSKLYVCGGYCDQAMEVITSSVEVLDLDHPNEWTYIRPMCQERYFANCVAVDGFFFVLGGGGTSDINERRLAQRERVASTVERYNPTDNVWELMPSMRERADFAVCVHEDKIWCLGGGNENSQFNQVESWKPFVGTISSPNRQPLGRWESSTPLPNRIWAHRCVNVTGLEIIEPFLTGSFDHGSSNENASNSFWPSQNHPLRNPERVDVKRVKRTWTLVIGNEAE